MGKRFKHNWTGTVLVNGKRYLLSDFPEVSKEAILKKLTFWRRLWTIISSLWKKNGE